MTASPPYKVREVACVTLSLLPLLLHLPDFILQIGLHIGPQVQPLVKTLLVVVFALLQLGARVIDGLKRDGYAASLVGSGKDFSKYNAASLVRTGPAKAKQEGRWLSLPTQANARQAPADLLDVTDRGGAVMVAPGQQSPVAAELGPVDPGLIHGQEDQRGRTPS